MKRSLLFSHRFAAATLATLYLSSAASAGVIYLDNDTGANINQYIPPSGTATILSSSLGTEVTGMAVSYNDTNVVAPYVILVADYGGGSDPNGEIYAYSPGGSRSIFNSTVTNPTGIAVDQYGNVYVGANGGAELEELSSTGVVDATLQTGLAIQSLAVNAAGDVFEAQSGKVTELVGGTWSSPALTGGTNLGMAFDYDGDLFVTYANSSIGGGIDEINAAGNLSVLYSSTTVLPTGVAYDPENGTLYMSYSNSFEGSGGGGIVSFDIGAGGTFTTSLAATTFATVPSGSGSPDAILYAAPEPGSLLLSICGLISIGLFHFRRVRRPVRAESGRA